MSNVFKRAFVLKLNAGAFEDLAHDGIVPADVTRALLPLRDRDFASPQELTAALPPLIGEEPARRYAAPITRAARVLRPRRLLRYLGSFWAMWFAPSRLLPGYGSYLMLRPLVFGTRLRLRWWWFALSHRLHGSGAVSQERNANLAGFEHNRKQVLSFLQGHRNRTESLMNILRTIQTPDLRGAKLLCVGPRNEAEVLLLQAYGFPARNIEAIDLFTYSPRIKLMDMNALSYVDNSFDVYYSSAVIRYSPDIRKTVSESIRVTRPGGIMAYGFTFGMLGDLIPTGAEMRNGIADLLALYAGHVEHVYWQEEFEANPGDFRATVIFRLRK